MDSFNVEIKFDQGDLLRILATDRREKAKKDYRTDDV